MGANAKLYDRDFYAWTREQAALLREGRLADADLANLAEEIESMGRSERHRLYSRLSVLLTHLAKWRFQPGLRSRSWELTIREQRRRAAMLLRDNPSLGPALTEIAADAWARAALAAQRETGLDESNFPEVCPWTPEQALDDDFLPD